MRLSHKITGTILLAAAIFPALQSQQFIREEVEVSFGQDSLYPVSYALKNITDTRNLPPNVVAIGQDKKYLIKYFDVYYKLSDSLTNIVSQAFRWDESQANPLSLEITHFTIDGFSKKTPGGTSLYSEVKVSVPKESGSAGGASGEPLDGTLVHQINYKRPFLFKSEKLPFGDPVEDWKLAFSRDLNRIRQGEQPVNFYPGTVRSHLVARSQVHVGLKTLIVDGELWFSRPEAATSFTAAPFVLRYRNAPKFESLGFKVKNSYSHFRLNENFMLLSRFSTFIGINRWKDFDEMKLGFQHIPHLNISLSQGIVYQPKYKSGIVAGIGITEDVVGIVGMKIMFDPALFVMLGIKI